jgi:hypothetical protein
MKDTRMGELEVRDSIFQCKVSIITVNNENERIREIVGRGWQPKTQQFKSISVQHCAKEWEM